MFDILEKKMFLPGFEPGTFCVWDRRDNHYTTETHIKEQIQNHLKQKQLDFALSLQV
jgi:hypothetical protein